MQLRIGINNMKFKNFRQQLDERKRASAQVKQLLSSRAKPYEYWLSKKFTIPFCISKPMMTRMQVTQTDVEAFHVTDIDHIKAIFDIQNSAKSLSVTTELEDKRAGVLMLEGVETAGGILVELIGDVPFAGDFDIFTSADNQGRRWIDLYQFATAIREKKNRVANPDLLHNWELVYKKKILEHTKAFIKKNWNELLDMGLDGDHMGYAVRTKEWAAIFWIGGEGFIVKGLNSDESLAEKGVVDKLERNPDGRGLVRKAKQALYKMTKDLFDSAETYFTDNILDFFELGQENNKIYPYNELVMDNFTVQRVLYNDQYSPEDLIRELSDYMSEDEIRAGAMPVNKVVNYFAKWVKKGPSYPDVTKAWTS